MTISVLIPVLNERKALPELMSDIKSQTHSVKEIIIGDCGSTDGTLDFLENNEPDVIISRSNIKNPAGGRNAASKNATGDILLFIDADVRVNDTFIEKLVARHTKLGRGLSSPRLLSDDKSYSGKLHERAIHNWVTRSYKKNEPVGAGGVICVDASLFRELKGFNESMQKGEDADFFTRASRLGASVRYIQDISYVASSRRVRGLRGLLFTFFEDAPVFSFFCRKRSHDRYK